jgi:hypothetical protein
MIYFICYVICEDSIAFTIKSCSRYDLELAYAPLEYPVEISSHISCYVIM